MTDPWALTGTDRAAVDALLDASHGDPFSVLGWHEVAPGVHVVRCIVPGASEVAVVDADGRVRARSRRSRATCSRAGRRARRPHRLPAADRRRAAARGPLPLRVRARRARLHLLAQGTHWRAWRALGANARVVDGVRRHRVRGLGAERAGRVGRCRIVQRLGRARAPDAPTARGGGVGSSSCRGWATGALYKYELLGAGGERLLKGEPYARHAEPPPATASRVRHDRPSHGRRRVARVAATAAVPRRADVGLRGSPRLVDAPSGRPPARVSRTRRVAGAPTRGAWASPTSN